MRLGIDILAARNFSELHNAKTGLCTNIAACDCRNQPTFFLLAKQPKVRLNAVFAPEHGLFGAYQDQIKIPSFFEKTTKIRVSSLYNDRIGKTYKKLENIDILLIDLIDIGTRYYTYLWSALLLIKEAAKLGKKVIVLDRPNPLGGSCIQGPVLDPKYISFVGLYPVPIRHGMTIGELASLVKGGIMQNCDLEIVRMKGWKRKFYFIQTGLKWTMPSPNMPLFSTACVYPGMCLLEGTNISEGRGTTRPFELFGAPWLDSYAFIKRMRKKKLPGVEFRCAYFIPTFNKYAGKLCSGAQLYIDNLRNFNPVITALEIIKTIKSMHPENFKWRKPPYEMEKKKMPFDILIGNGWVRKAIGRKQSIRAIKKRWQGTLRKFKKHRKKHLLYE